MTIELHLRIVGVLMLGLVSLNFFAPKKLGWHDDLARVGLLTRQVFYVHLLFIMLVITMFSVLAIFFTHTLLAGGLLARLVLGGIALFWLVRLVAQLFIYDTRLWRGHRFNTSMHILFTALWTYFAAVFGWATWIVSRG